MTQNPGISFAEVTFLSKLDDFYQIFDVYPVYYFWTWLNVKLGDFSADRDMPDADKYEKNSLSSKKLPVPATIYK